MKLTVVAVFIVAITASACATNHADVSSGGQPRENDERRYDSVPSLLGEFWRSPRGPAARF